MHIIYRRILNNLDHESGLYKVAENQIYKLRFNGCFSQIIRIYKHLIYKTKQPTHSWLSGITHIGDQSLGLHQVDSITIGQQANVRKKPNSGFYREKKPHRTNEDPVGRQKRGRVLKLLFSLFIFCHFVIQSILTFLQCSANKTVTFGEYLIDQLVDFDHSLVFGK